VDWIRGMSDQAPSPSLCGTSPPYTYTSIIKRVTSVARLISYGNKFK
jgi:hypothetical protein